LNPLIPLDIQELPEYWREVSMLSRSGSYENRCWHSFHKNANFYHSLFTPWNQ